MSKLVTLGVWLSSAALACWLLIQHEARLAVGEEHWLGPAALAGIHLVMALTWEGIWALIRRLWRDLRWARLAPALTALVFWLPALASPRPELPEPASGQGRDIVLITLDTFRADLYPAYTPELEALAEGGLRFTQAVTTAPLTAPAHASMLTGLEVREHGLLANGRRVQVDSVVEELQRSGYTTGAFLGAQVLDRHTGLDAGFQHYDDRWGVAQRMEWHPLIACLDLEDRGHQRPGVQVIERALAWRSIQAGPTLTWIHLYDAHAPYGQPRGHGPTPEELDQAREADQTALRRRDGMQSLVEFLNSARPHEQTLRYRAGGRYTDHLVGSLLEELDEDTLIVVVGDHGESLTEHDYDFNHGRKLYEPSLHVPLIVAHPDLAPAEVSSLAGVTQIAAWLRWGAGLGDQPGALTRQRAYTTGQQAHGTAIKPRDRKLEHTRAAALRLDGAKLVLHPDRPSGEWFDLRIDPWELDPQPVPEVLQDELEQLRAMVSDKPAGLDEEQRRRLEALGYIE
jgi:arylsulfatase A-like enzyme